MEQREEIANIETGQRDKLQTTVTDYKWPGELREHLKGLLLFSMAAASSPCHPRKSQPALPKILGDFLMSLNFCQTRVWFSGKDRSRTPPTYLSPDCQRNKISILRMKATRCRQNFESSGDEKPVNLKHQLDIKYQKDPVPVLVPYIRHFFVAHTAYKATFLQTPLGEHHSLKYFNAQSKSHMQSCQSKI